MLTLEPGTPAVTAGAPAAHGPAATAADVDCVVLCGGRGTRLRGVVPDRPKALAEVSGRPFLEWLLLALQRQGVRRVVLASGHGADALRRAVGDGGMVGLEVVHSAEPGPLGTGGALRHATPHLRTGRVVVLNADTWCTLDLAGLLAAHEARGAVATVQVAAVDDVAAGGAVTLDADGTVTRFSEKGGSGPGLVSTGVAVIERSVLDLLDDGVPLSLECDILPGLIGHGLRAHRVDGPLVDIGTPQGYAAAGSVLVPALGDLSRHAARVGNGAGAARVGGRA